MNNKVHVKTGDEVIVINGKNRGMKGKVLQVSPAEGKVIVEGVNIVTKHVKPRKMGEPGGLIKAESALYASKVQLICRSAAARPGLATRSTARARRCAPARRATASLSLNKGRDMTHGKTQGTLCQ